MAEKWWKQGLCVTHPTPQIFEITGGVHAPHKKVIKLAKAVCNTCPSKGPCLQSAIKEEEGIWNPDYLTGVRGGNTPKERITIRALLIATQSSSYTDLNKAPETQEYNTPSDSHTTDIPIPVLSFCAPIPEFQLVV